MQPTQLPRKKDVALALLEQATVFVHIDPRSVEVRVPTWFKRQPQLVLQIGLNMPVPIPDLEVSDQGLSCTLSFNRAPHWCKIPWGSVFALVGESGRGMVWPDDVPPEVAAQAQKQQAAQAVREVPPPEEQKKALPAKASAPAKARSGAKARASSKARAAQPARATKSSEAKKPRTQKKASPARPVAVAQKAAPPRARPEAQPAVTEARAAGGNTRTSAAAKKKRALPPYLRVVK
jgi:stringent starvation protein B